MSRYLLTNEKQFPVEENILVFNEFEKFKETFFDKGVSFFDTSIELFDNEEVFNEFEKRIITNYDTTNRRSIEKYQEQLLNSSEKVRHFFANIIWLYNYPIHDKKNSTKTFELKTYLGNYYNDNLSNVEIKHSGIANYGLLSQYIYYDINFIYFFVKEYIKTKENPNDILNSLDLSSLMLQLTNEGIKHMKFLASRHILNYIFNPDKYEPIVNTTCKRNIVKHFLNKYNDKTLDDDIYKIRKEEFGFEESIYNYICGEQAITLKNTNVKVVEYGNLKKKEFEISLSSKNFEEDIFEKEKTKIENGENAELLVYNEVIKYIDKKVLFNQISKVHNIKEFNSLNDKLEDLIHYSKNIDKYAPFDLISTRGQEIVYIEVKSTTGSEIYFSRAEIDFAYKNLDNYEVRIVKDNKIYELDLDEIIIDIYLTMSEKEKWTFETIKFKLKFN